MWRYNVGGARGGLFRRCDAFFVLAGWMLSGKLRLEVKVFYSGKKYL